MLHDIGKPRSKRRDIQARWTFHNHGYVGSRIISGILRRLKFLIDSKVKYVRKMVGMHIRPIAVTDEEVTNSTVRRSMSDVGDDTDGLMTLCEADIISKDIQRRQRLLDDSRAVHEKLGDPKERDYKRLLQPYIDGDEIMETFHL